ncbi:neutral ceramidase-like [Triplophysa dalaica]|uniref:neutral ceramidase-like n=1 Tax=Triplophysa dalaica TaxID=1582913 RepID=UPI0024DF4B5A|nr:neutral ceramidase-like [Triplophysa dalaica]XP_056628172.1 neutral ceramidase-like [Triplophysa dalaica]
MYGDLYRQDNVVMSGTHSGLARYFQFTLFMITSSGYIKPSVQAMLNGTLKSIDISHRNLRPARILIILGELITAI